MYEEKYKGEERRRHQDDQADNRRINDNHTMRDIATAVIGGIVLAVLVTYKDIPTRVSVVESQITDIKGYLQHISDTLDRMTVVKR